MTTYVRINNGSYRNSPIIDRIFPLVAEYKRTATKQFVTVDGTGIGHGVKIRVSVDSRDAYDIVSEEAYLNQNNTPASAATPIVIPEVVRETDEEMEERIAENFEVLDLMTKATIASEIRAMIVTGPPGVGKSYGVEQELEKTALFDKVAGKRLRYGFMKGTVTPIALYAALYKYSEKGNVIVFDDCDGALQDEDCLNMLKCALDSGKTRRISWGASRSTYLEAEGIPDSFDFKGSVVFITNLDFTEVRSKKQAAHLGALMSRCHYLDLALNTMREKFIRIRQVAATGKLFNDYNFDEETEAEVLNFMYDNKDHLREVSLRMCLKIADLRKMSETRWEKLARSTCMFNMTRFAK